MLQGSEYCSEMGFNELIIIMLPCILFSDVVASAQEVMFTSCLSVSRITEQLLVYFHESWCKGVAWAKGVAWCKGVA